jgi:dTDP-4-dehydrorhamnose reductase
MLVTGGSGFLGRHLTTGHASDRWELIAPSSSSMDITRRDSTIDAITDWKPAAVVHLAYRKGERQSIVGGSRYVAEAAAACGARLIHMSTDVIFSGRAAPYTEADRPFPTIDYGRDKRDAEDAVMLACPTAVMIRTSLLYGTGRLGHVQLDVQGALSTGSDRRPMTFFTDEYRCPVHAADVANAIAELATRPDIVGPLNVAGPDVLSRSDFARATALWMGHDPNRLLTSTIAEAGLVRPARIALDTSMAATLGITCRSVSESYGLS